MSPILADFVVQMPCSSRSAKVIDSLMPTSKAAFQTITVGKREIRVYRQRRRSIAMKTTPIGLVMFMPMRLSLRDAQVHRFIHDALNKIGDKVAPSLADAPEVTSPLELRRLVKTWAAHMGLHPARVTIREMFRKWGSCSERGSISLNTALCRVPRELAEYVICHELVHLVEFNHGKGFQAMMDAHMGDWRAREQALQAWMEGGTLD
jgi:predicted metal-dependent hydrolase